MSATCDTRVRAARSAFGTLVVVCTTFRAPNQSKPSVHCNFAVNGVEATETFSTVNSVHHLCTLSKANYFNVRKTKITNYSCRVRQHFVPEGHQKT